MKKKTPWSPSNSQSESFRKAISKTWSTPASIIMKLKKFGSTSARHKVGSLTQWSLRVRFIGPLKRYLLEGWPCRWHFINQAFKVKWLDRSHSRKKTSDSPIGICQMAFSRTPRTWEKSFGFHGKTEVFHHKLLKLGVAASYCRSVVTEELRENCQIDTQNLLQSVQKCWSWHLWMRLQEALLVMSWQVRGGALIHL